MPVPNRLTQVAAKSLGVVLASSLVVSSVLMAGAFAQEEVGPLPPQKKPQQLNPVSQAVSKFIKGKKTDKNKGEDDEESSDAAEKPVVAIPKGSVKDTEPRSFVQHPPLLNQPPLTNAKIDEPQVDTSNPPPMGHPKLDDPTNPLGFTEAETKLRRYITLVDAKRFEEAKPGLVQLRQFLVDLTEAHIGLYKTLNQLPSARGQAELEKELALEFAQLRDRAMMETAKVYISERDYPRAVKELTEVVKSQPKSKLGLRSYEILQEIGFTEKLQLTQ